MVQPLLAFIFVFFTLAAGHLVMVIINNDDFRILKYSPPCDRNSCAER